MSFVPNSCSTACHWTAELHLICIIDFLISEHGLQIVIFGKHDCYRLTTAQLPTLHQIFFSHISSVPIRTTWVLECSAYLGYGCTGNHYQKTGEAVLSIRR